MTDYEKAVCEVAGRIFVAELGEAVKAVGPTGSVNIDRLISESVIDASTLVDEVLKATS